MRDNLVGRQLEHRLLKREEAGRDGSQICSAEVVFPDDNDLGVGLREVHGRNAVGRGEDAELPSQPGQQLQRLLRLSRDSFAGW